ncbi:MAG TPA: NAD(P)/FAD-dependent oxidoreductase [Puia sp.]
MTEHKLNVGIAGAGIAGLVAGLELLDAGYAVSIFEAAASAGGRIQSLTMDGLVIETGPEFIHGSPAETIGLLKKYKIPFYRGWGKMFRASKGHLTETQEMIKDWDKLLEKMKSLEDDLPFMDFLEKNFSGEKYNGLRESAIRFAEGFDLADVQMASTQGLTLEWNDEESEQYRVEGGYEKLIDALSQEFKNAGGKLLFYHAVRQVRWDTENIIVATENERKFNLEKLIVTVPLGALNQSAASGESIVFYPAINEKMEAFRNIGYGTVIKIVLVWNSLFWKKLIPGVQFIFSDSLIPTWWTQFPRDIPMLTGWLGGPQADRLANEPDEFFKEKAIESLASIFSLSADKIRESLKSCMVFNWRNKPWSRGAYSYPKYGSGSAIAICRQSLSNRIYFAGEAYYEGPYPGTVEAAIINGKETSRQLITEI